MMITLTLCGFNPINILAMVYIMYSIIFQCIRMIKNEKNNISKTFCKIVNFTFSACKLKKPIIFQTGP